MSIRMGRSTKNQPIPSIERARNFRMRIKQNPEIHEAYREKERERYRRRRLNKSLKSIGDLSESEKREQREKWRISKREARAKQRFSQIVTESPSTPVTYIIRLENNDNLERNAGTTVTCRIKQEIGERESSSENPGPSLTEKEVTSNFNTNKEYSPTPRKRGRPRKEGRPLTSAERQRNYRKKIKQDRESLEAYQERARNRYVIAKNKKTVKGIDDLSESEKIQQREYWRIRKRQSRRTKRHSQTLSECSSPPLTYIIRQEDESVDQNSGLDNVRPLLTCQIKQEVDEESAENQENGSYIENPRTPVTCRIKQELDDEGWIANSQPLNASEVGVIQTVGECVESSPMKLNVVLHSENPNPLLTMNETNRNQQMVSNCSPASHEIKDYPQYSENTSSRPTNTAKNGGAKLGTVSLCSSPQHTIPLREPDGERSLSSTADNSDKTTGIVGLTEMPTCPDKDPIALELTCDSENPQTFSDDCDDEDFVFDFHTPEPSPNDNGVNNKITLHSNVSKVKKDAKRSSVKKRPLTNTERMRNYMIRIKQNPAAHKEYRRRERERNRMRRMNKSLKRIGEMTESEKRKQREKWRRLKREYRKKREVSPIVAERSCPPLTYSVKLKNQDQKDCLPDAGPPVTYKIKRKNQGLQTFGNAGPSVTARNKSDFEEPESCIENSQSSKSAREVSGSLRECATSPLIKIEAVWNCEYPELPLTMNGDLRMNQNDSNCPQPSCEIKDLVGCLENYENTSSRPAKTVENCGAKSAIVSLCSSPQNMLPVLQLGGDIPGCTTADNSDKMTDIMAERSTCGQSPKIGEQLLTCESESAETLTGNSYNLDLLRHSQTFNIHEPLSNDTRQVLIPSKVSEIQKVDEYCNNPGQLLEEEEGATMVNAAREFSLPPPEKKVSVKKRQRPLTPAERQRNYRLRMKENQEKGEAYRERERQRYRIRKMNKALKSIHEMSESEKREQRERWRISQKDARKKRAQVVPEFSLPVPECSLPPLIYRPRVRQGNRDYNGHPESWPSVTCTIDQKKEDFVEEHESCIENLLCSKSAGELDGSLGECATSPLIKTEVVWNCENPELPLTMNGDLTKKQDFSNCSQPSCEIKEVVGYPENYENTSFHPTNIAGNDRAKLGIVSLCLSPQHTMHVLQLDGDTPGSSTADNSARMTGTVAERSTCGKSQIGEVTCDSERTETFADKCNNSDLLLHCQTFNSHEPPSNDTGQILMPSKFSEIREMDEYCNNPGQSLEEEEGTSMFNAAGEYSLPPPPVKKTSPVNKRQRPLTPAERQKNYRLRMKQNQEKDEAYRERERQRYRIRKMNKALKSIHEMSESEKREQREKWRISQRDARKKKAVSQVVPECSLPPLMYKVRQEKKDCRSFL